ncbi:MAG: hypothetical protein Q9228_005504 [Teloschistes exilis]
MDQLRSYDKIAPPEESEEPIDGSIAKQDDSARKERTPPSQRLFLNTTRTSPVVQAEDTPPRKLKSSVSLSQRKEELRSTSWLIALLRLPYPLSRYAICVTAQAWFSRLAWPSAICSISAKTILPNGAIFMEACAAGEVNAVRRLALEGLGLPTSIDEAGRPALHHAIRSGSFELVKFLLDNGASPDELESRRHVSPLQEACRMGLISVARLLLAKGAFLEHVDYGGRTALSMLWFDPNRSFCTVDFLKILLAYSPMPSTLDPCDGFGPLPCAAMKGNSQDLALLVKSGAYQSSNDTPGDRIIKYSIIGSNPDTFDFFAPLMPDGWVFEVDYRGRGPLHMALEYRSRHAKEITQRLLRAGADVHLRDADGNDPRDLARVCDARGRHLGLQEPGNTDNTNAYFDALRASGFDVELDEEGVMWWPSMAETSQVSPDVLTLV